jgi:ribosomal protein L27
VFEHFALERDESASAAGTGREAHGIVQRSHDPGIGEDGGGEAQDAVIAGNQLVRPRDDPWKTGQVRQKCAVQLQMQEILAAQRGRKRFAGKSVGNRQKADAPG